MVWIVAALAPVLAAGAAIAQNKAGDPKSPPTPPTRPAPPKQPDAKPPVDPAPADDLELVNMIRVVGEPTSVDELLDALETGDRGITTFQAQVMYDRRFVLQGDRHVRYGDLYFAVARAEGDPRPRRTFAIDFRTLEIEGVRRDDRNAWVFDGQWLVEKRPAEKQYIARQVAAPDSPIDPLGLGESPIPFPIGQKKTAILERYDATFLKASDGLAPPDDAEEEEIKEIAALKQSVEGAYQLRLVPKDVASSDDQFKEIRLWYTKDDLLPRMAKTINRSGDESIVLLIDRKVNEELPAHAIAIEPPPEEEGWDVQIDSGRFAKPEKNSAGD